VWWDGNSASPPYACEPECESPHICWLVSPPKLLWPVYCIFKYGLLVCKGTDPAELLLAAPNDDDVVPVGSGEIVSNGFLMGIPAGGPARRASGSAPSFVGAAVVGLLGPLIFSVSGRLSGVCSSSSD
jgi:hypothetical protein